MANVHVHVAAAAAPAVAVGVPSTSSLSGARAGAEAGAGRRRGGGGGGGGGGGMAATMAAGAVGATSSFSSSTAAMPLRQPRQITVTSTFHVSHILGRSLSLTVPASTSGTQRCHNYNQGLVVIRCKKSGEPLRRPSLNTPPAAPSTLPAPPSSPPQSSSPAPSATPAEESTTTASSPAAAPAAAPPSTTTSNTTIEYQRRRAKEMQEYFLDKKYEDETYKSRIFGWTRSNEINNGRWVMFGLAVGLLTEYATGSDFVEQLKIIVSNLGILDVD